MSESRDQLLQRLAAEATSTPERLSRLLELSIKPGQIKFVREHVVVHGGPNIVDVVEALVITYARLTAEAIDNGRENGVGPDGIIKLVDWACAVFAAALGQTLSQNFTTHETINRLDA